jgi:peptidoglycan/xylan/chitin deacetylase (PgdA/CDA1 family)
MVVAAALCASLWGHQSVPGGDAAAPAATGTGACPTAVEPTVPAADAAAETDSSRVAILGYHDFSESDPETEMRIRPSKFRRQLEVIRELGLTVVSMDQFVRWKGGELDLPERCVMITIDDGWKAVYTDAFPILREFGHPFTIFLYKNYIEGGNKALSAAMIRELLGHGATVGSHSVSHPYPAEIKKLRAEGLDVFTRFIRTEMGESKRYLEMTFGRRVPIFAYPGGFFTDDMFPIAAEIGYSHLFTVEPGKVGRDTPDRMIPRYMILGTHDRVFELATDFRTAPAPPAGTIAGLTESLQLAVNPPPGGVVNDRLPLIEANVAHVADLDPASLVMRVGGFGTVPAAYDPATGRFAWQVDRPLRQRFCHVTVSWKAGAGRPAAGGADSAGAGAATPVSTAKSAQDAPEPLRWSFQVDRSAAYLP